MKNSLTLILLLCLLSCRPEAEHPHQANEVNYPPILKEVNRLADVDAVQAMHLIDSIGAEMAHAPEPVQMYYKLLTVKVLEKQGIRHSSSGMMRSVLDYYEQQADQAMLPKAYYYMGCTYRDLKVYPLALEHFQKALDFAVQADDTSAKGLLYSQMASLLGKQELYDNALFAYRQAFLCDSLVHDAPGMVYALRDIGLIHRQRRSYDSAYYYYQRAERIANAQGDLMLRHVAALEIADLQLDRRKYDDAWNTLQPVLTRLTDENQGKANLLAAEIFYHTYQYNKVSRYATEATIYGTNAQKSRAYYLLSRIAAWRKDYKAYEGYLSNYTSYALRDHDGEAAAAMAEMNSLYNYQQALKENADLAKKGERKSQAIALLVLIIAVLSLAALIVYDFMRRKREAMTVKLHELETDQKEQMRQAERSVSEKMQRISDLENLLEQAGTENSALHSHIEEMQQALREQVDKQMLQMKARKDTDNKLKDTDIYRRVIYLINRQRVLTQKDYLHLRDTFEELYPDFMQRLFELCELSDLEVEVSLLRRMGVSPNDIAMLTDYTKAHISGVRRSLYARVFGIKGSPSDWDDLISSL